MTDAVGTINFWGFSPAIDLIKEIKSCNGKETSNDFEELHILIVGAGDLRHVLQTLSCVFRHTSPSNIALHFYILESHLEIYARHLLLMSLCIEPTSTLGLQDKVEMFLELYGNILIRQKTIEYLQQFTQEAIKWITDLDYLKQKVPSLDLSMLKFKERDFMEAIMKLWKDEKRVPFDGRQCWDLRVRHHLGVRYDAIPNVFDWDCSMVLHDRGADIIHSKEYQHWRWKGVAFELREAAYDVSNRSLMSGSLLRTNSGDKTARIGYWGDIVCSPFLAWGVESENKDFFKKSNNQYIYGANHVAEFNVAAMLHRFALQQEYNPPKEVKPEPDKKKVESIEEVDEEENQESPKMSAEESASNVTQANSDGDQSTEADVRKTANFQIHLLPLNSLSDVIKKPRFQRLFHAMYFGSSLSHLLSTNPDLHLCLRSDMDDQRALLLVESALLIPELNKDQVAAYVDKVCQMAKHLNCQPTSTPDPLKDFVLRFTHHPL